MKRGLNDFALGSNDSVNVKLQKLNSVRNPASSLSSPLDHQTCTIHCESPSVMELIVRIFARLSALNDKSPASDAVAVILSIKELYDIGACAANPHSIHMIVSKYVELWLAHYQTHHFVFCPTSSCCVAQPNSLGCASKAVRHFLVDILFYCNAVTAAMLVKFVSQQFLQIGGVQICQIHLRDYRTQCGETILHYLLTTLCTRLSLLSVRFTQEKDISWFKNALGKVPERESSTNTTSLSSSAIVGNRDRLGWEFQQCLSKKIMSASTNDKLLLSLCDEMDQAHVIVDTVLWLLAIPGPVFVFETGLISHQKQPLFSSVFELMIQTNHPYSLPLAKIFYNALPQYAVDSRGAGLSPFLLSVKRFQFKWATWLAGTVPLRHVNLNMNLKHSHSTVIEQHPRFPKTLYTNCQVH